MRRETKLGLISSRYLPSIDASFKCIIIFALKNRACVYYTLSITINLHRKEAEIDINKDSICH